MTAELIARYHVRHYPTASFTRALCGSGGEYGFVVLNLEDPDCTTCLRLLHGVQPNEKRLLVQRLSSEKPNPCAS